MTEVVLKVIKVQISHAERSEESCIIQHSWILQSLRSFRMNTN